MQRRGWFDLIHRCANAAAPTSTPFGRAAATSPPQRQAAPPSMQCNCSDPWSVGRECRGGGAWMDGDLKVGEREGGREAGTNCAAMSMSTAHCHRRRRLPLLSCRRQRREALDRLVPSARRPADWRARRFRLRNRRRASSVFRLFSGSSSSMNDRQFPRLTNANVERDLAIIPGLTERSMTRRKGI